MVRTSPTDHRDPATMKWLTVAIFEDKNTNELDNAEDQLLVTRNGPDDPECPFNWSLTVQWGLTILTSMGGLVTLMSVSMLAPALPSIGKDLKISGSEANMAVSIFVLAFAFGPMVLAPLAEVFGRRNVFLVCSAWYVVWNTVCGFAKTKGVLLAARIMSGLGASAEFAVTNPVLRDCWRPEQRGNSFSIATFVPDTIGWPWLFWVLSIFDLVLIVYVFFFPETYHQLILLRKASFGRKVTISLIRPCWMLAMQPTIQLMLIFLAYNFGVLYFVLTSFASLWTDRYDQFVLISGLHYIAIVIGYTYLKTEAGGQITPEYRIPLLIPGTILLPAGLFWYGWSAQAMAPWIVVDIGAAVFGCDIILSTQAMQQYVMESYRDYVASASAASQFLRSIFAFCFPLFAPALYNHLGCGWGNSVLGFIALRFEVPEPFLIWFYGARLREVGRKRMGENLA
ncbi:major facilitator superfamily transporter [Aspergillus ibericus CBS 121593]|uniref:Major facilitator superfamily transporter n=1 Tax=Aspergillus ibericus CBS 121593 TaxID=1448316 RepID=A0A395H0W1_9EURO|nr:major facilitator superfamily transporter [Aspergillus ibericus CBS 121593]RAK99933.1 major facilitator superfamily transporter [Aspergillus ibericus CBS 121593]